MANQSTLTRKQQVLRKLRAHFNEWVDGPELANEQVGGSEGLKRLRELRQDGHDIRMRAHPDPQRDIWQYKLVPGRTAPPPVRRPVLQLDLAGDEPEVPTEPVPVWAGLPAETQPSAHRISEVVRRTEDGRYELTQPVQTKLPEELAQPQLIKFKRMPKDISFGKVAICPRCKGKTGKTAGPDFDGTSLHKDPHTRKPEPCLGCNGYGLIPNVGPIPLTFPEGPGKTPGLDPENDAPNTEAFPE